MYDQDTIAAISTPPGMGAIAIVRLSGPAALEIGDHIFTSPSAKKLKDQLANTSHFGYIQDDNEMIDEVVVNLFKTPHSYTGEDLLEISCHGSVYIQQRILKLLTAHGARTARPGEFTMRAFMNGKLDLTQVEAVADLITSASRTAHRVAMKQMRGGFTHEIKILRDKLLQFISLIELELDFSEEDVEFADRSKLKVLLEEIVAKLSKLKNSFELGNVLKSGIPVAIAGNTNSGKSTLLNLLLKEDKAIVSEIAGTTRDFIEDTINIRGLLFRIIDTAGIRHTEDTIELIGIERTWQKITQANVILQMIDGGESLQEIVFQVKELNRFIGVDKKHRIIIINKIDTLPDIELQDILAEISEHLSDNDQLVAMSAKNGHNLSLLEDALINASGLDATGENDVIITSARHYEALERALSAMERTADGLQSRLAGDLLAQDIRESLHYLGEITGEINDNEILGNIFKNFCIGK